MRKLYLLIVFALFISCDEVFDDTFYIQNNMNDKITLIYRTNDQELTDTLVVQPNEKKQVFNAHSAGGTTQYRIPVANVFNIFEVSLDANNSQYNYFNDDNWEYTPTSETTADYIMIVDSTHFE